MTGYPPGLTDEVRATRVWYHGGPGARSGVWLARQGRWGYHTWTAIGDAATGLLAAVDARSARRRLKAEDQEVSWLVRTRIRDALDHMDAHGSWVDLALGATPPHDVDRWEDGTLSPTRMQLARLCWLTGRPPIFYVPDGGPASITYGHACIRHGQNRKCHLIEVDAVDGLTIRGRYLDDDGLHPTDDRPACGYCNQPNGDETGNHHRPTCPAYTTEEAAHA